jgi:hypothetical protein
VDQSHFTPAARSTINIDGEGNRVYRTNGSGEILQDTKVLEKLRREGVGKKVWGHTVDVWKKALALDSDNGN